MGALILYLGCTVGSAVECLRQAPTQLIVQDKVQQILQHARESGNFNNSSYIMKNAEEFWAESSQAWFEATVRTDVTSGLRSRWELAERLPQMAALMLVVYGRNEWLYPHTAPKQFARAPPDCAGRPLEEVEVKIAEGLSQSPEQVHKLAQTGAGSAHSAPPRESDQWPKNKDELLQKGKQASTFLRGKLKKFMREH